MHFSPIACFSATALILASAVTASAQQVEILGTLTGTVDGEVRNWYVTSAEMQGETVTQSDFMGDPAVGATVSLFGHASESVMNSTDSILLSFSVNGPRAPKATGIEITYGGFSKVDGESGFYSSDNEGDARITVDAFGAEGEALRITGSFSGVMPFQARGADAPDMDHVITVTDGSFDTLILPMSF